MSELLRSWKEIARHMGTSVRTAQRWEREFRLPVRRIEVKRGAVVFAFGGELDTWLRTRSESPVPLVQDSFFRTVFMDSQFPSVVVDDIPRILAANLSAAKLAGVTGSQLLGEKLDRVLCADGHNGYRLGDWAGYLKRGTSFGRANLQCHDGHKAGIEFVVKRFVPGLHVVSVLAVRKPWPAEQLGCRFVERGFSLQVRPGSSPNLALLRRNPARYDAP